MRRLWFALGVLGLLAVVWLVLSRRGSDAVPSEAPVSAAPRADGDGATNAPAARAAAADGAAASPLPVAEMVEVPSARSEPTSSQPTCIVYGSARVDSGETVELRLSLVSAAGAKRNVTARNGAFVVPGVPKGSWTLTCSYFGFHTEERKLEVASDELRVDFLLRKVARIAIHARTSSGKPPIGVEFGPHGESLGAVATMAKPAGDLPLEDGSRPPRIGLAQWQASREGRSSGRLGDLLFEEAVPAVYHVSLVLRSTVLATKRVEGLPAEIVFEVESDMIASRFATARLKVVDEHDRPIPGVQASATTTQSSSSEHQRPTEIDGAVTISRLLPGLWQLELRAPEREFHFSTHRIHAGQDHDLGVVRLGPVLNPSGLLVDARGAPIAGARVTYRSLASSGRLPWHSETDAAGVFVMRSVGRGAWLLRAVAEATGQVAVARVELTGEPDQKLRLVAQPGWLVTLRLVCSPDAAHALRVEDAAGLTWWSTPLATARWPPRARLPDGSYRLFVGDGETWRQSVAFRVAGRDQMIEVRP